MQIVPSSNTLIICVNQQRICVPGFCERFSRGVLMLCSRCGSRWYSQLWSPTKVGEIQQIEQVQKNFTRKIRNNSQEDYWCRLSRNNLYSLERRRERYRIIYVWKILEGMVPNLSGQSELRAKPSLRFGRMCSVPPRPASA